MSMIKPIKKTPLLIFIAVALVLGGALVALSSSTGLLSQSSQQERAPFKDEQSKQQLRPLAAEPALSTSAIAPVQAASLAAAIDREKDAERARKALELALIEKQWCTHGAQAHAQAVASIDEGKLTPPTDPKQYRSWLDDPEVERDMDRRAKATNALPTSIAGFEVERRLKKQWIERLQKLGDARSLATAAFFEWDLAHPFRPEDVEQARLTQMARSSSDPFPIELWLASKGYCSIGSPCPPDLNSRWSVIEPANALAWMPMFGDQPSMTAAQWQGLAQSRYVRSQSNELQRRLLALLGESGGSGLEREKGLEMIQAVVFLVPTVRSLHVLIRDCEALPKDSPHRSVCVHVADLIWNASEASTADRFLARALAEKMGVDGSDRWAQRTAELKTLERRVLAVQDALTAKFNQEGANQKGCAGHAHRFRMLKAIAEKGEMRFIEEAVTQAEQAKR